LVYLQQPSKMSGNVNSGLPAQASELAGAFELFVEASQALEQQYAALSLQVETLNADLVQANDRLNVLLNALPAAVILIENEQISHFNQAAKQLVPGLITGAPWSTPPQWKAGQGPDEFHLTTPSGIRTLQAQRVQDGQRSVIQIQDITANLRTLEENERVDRLAAMGKMSAGIAHQLRTPLSTALLYASHLCTPELDTQDRVTFAQKLKNQLVHLEKMASDMLQFIRSRPLKTQTIPLDELVQEAMQTLDGLAQQKNVKINATLQAEGCVVSVERPSVVSALVAILENAIQSSASGAFVHISTLTDGMRGQVSIQDQGPGIAPDMLPRLFEPFATNRVTGTGLGLAIAQNAIRSHRGEINAHNRAEGGAVFTVTLPVMANL
jgi:two-component system sensor histidine kinase FlrB